MAASRSSYTEAGIIKRVRLATLVFAALAGAAPTGAALARNPSARMTLGTFDGWGAFRDAAPLRCFAIAEPISARGGRWRPFASVASWPASGVRGQFHARLSRERRSDTRVTLSIDDRRFALVASTTDAWARDARQDAAIVAAMRSARSMSLATVAATGGGFADSYALKGAATAIDAAALGCNVRAS